MGLSDSIFNRLLRERIIWLGDEVRDDNANAICAQMMLLAAEDPDKDIYLYINSPGGSITAGMAIYDTMQYIKPEIQTVCLGQAASAAAVLLAAGTPGKRLALPNARVMIHQPHIEGGERAQASDIQIYAEEMVRMREWLEATLAHHTGQKAEKIREDIERDTFLSAEEAKAYGFVDQVLASRKAPASAKKD
jgi:ATP-dependent Clp protease protease subunit